MTTRFARSALAALTFAIAACSGAATPGPTPSPPAATPTPIAAEVTTPQDAANLVIASDPRFAGAVQFSPDLIGGSRTWTAEVRPEGGYRVSLTVGWGDCPAGCINQHLWVFDVSADGQLSLVNESGDPVPSDLPA